MDDNNFVIPSAVLSDLCSRFIINVPEEERNDLIRIFFQIEFAHWFYLDFYCDSTFNPDSVNSTNNNNNNDDDEEDSNEQLVLMRTPDSSNQLKTINKPLKKCGIRTFAINIFRHCPFLMEYSSKVDDIFSKWMSFKHAVPTNGAIILDDKMQYCLLVQGFWSKMSWGFPKGKVQEDESCSDCAVREVLEEIGYDIRPKLQEDQYIEVQINEQVSYNNNNNNQ
jgi:mRNA-decapping enzyme subunit 2